MKRLGKIGALALLLAVAGTVALSPQALAGVPITPQEAAALLGDTVAAPRISTTSGLAQGRKYFYRTAAPMSKHGRTGVLVVILYSAKTMAGYDGVFKTPKEVFGHMMKAKRIAEKRSGKKVAVEAPGIGDQAFWEPSAHTLHFMAHGAYVRVKIDDLKKITAGNRAELDNKIAAHRRWLAEKAAKLIIPRLGAL